METLIAAVIARGAQVRYDARGRSLVMDDDANVLGVVVTIDGRDVKVRARKGVVICTGGFIMNDTMMKNYSPKYRALFNWPNGGAGDDGSGILMGMAAGAGTINMHEGHITTPYYPPEELIYGILVNQAGQRFVNEDSYNGRTGTYCANQISNSSSRIYAIGTFKDFADYRTGSHNIDVAATGDTVAELESELAIPPGTLSTTIEFYNRHAAAGEDPLWHKNKRWLKPLVPPLVALDLTPGRGARYANMSLGGLHTLMTGEVLDLEGNIIPGLYAAGRASCGVTRYSATYWSGLSIGDATFFGRQAGKRVAARSSN
jgi:succinate dehydrogenase/fumarate reductase flavoprotein subunit